MRKLMLSAAAEHGVQNAALLKVLSPQLAYFGGTITGVACAFVNVNRSLYHAPQPYICSDSIKVGGNNMFARRFAHNLFC